MAFSRIYEDAHHPDRLTADIQGSAAFCAYPTKCVTGTLESELYLSSRMPREDFIDCGLQQRNVFGVNTTKYISQSFSIVIAATSVLASPPGDARVQDVP